MNPVRAIQILPKCIASSLLAILACSAIPAKAEIDLGSLALSPMARNSDESPIPSGLVVGGVGIYGQARYQASDDTLLAIPGAVYFGEQLIYLGDRARYYFYNNDGLSAYAYGRVRFGNLDPSDEAAFTGINERKWEFEAGFGGSYITPYAVLSSRISSDISGRSKGQEWLVWADFPIIKDRWLFMPGAGVIMRSSKMANYYFGGVSASEATASRPAWDTGNTISPSVGLITTYRFNKQWLGLIAVNYEYYDSGIRNSPLVQHDGELYVISGVGYVW
jgi:outer membrane protein